jgi:P-type conjugative transfer protein TrbJ
MKPLFLKPVLAALLGAAALALAPAPALALPVFDASNHAQNVVLAARALRQINQQIEMLQNQAMHLRRLDHSSLPAMTGALARIDRLIGEAGGIAASVASVNASFRALHPGGGAAGSAEAVRNAEARWESSMAAFRQTMGVQAQIVANVRADGAVLGELVRQSQGAVGGLQAAQATNQLLALAAKQQFQIQTLMAAQYRAEAIEQARRAQAESEARERARRFLGRGAAYTPR